MQIYDIRIRGCVRLCVVYVYRVFVYVFSVQSKGVCVCTCIECVLGWAVQKLFFNIGRVSLFCSNFNFHACYFHLKFVVGIIGQKPTTCDIFFLSRRIHGEIFRVSCTHSLHIIAESLQIIAESLQIIAETLQISAGSLQIIA